MALLPSAVATPAGSAVVPRLPVNGDTIVTGDDVIMVFNNTTAAIINVNVAATQQCSQGVLHPLVAAVAVGAVAQIGPIDKRYAAAVGGLATVTYTGGALAGSTAYTTRV
jgi:hypothetical protein